MSSPRTTLNPGVGSGLLKAGGPVNLAVTVVAPVIGSVQVPIPTQPPLQPAKTEPALGVAVSVTAVPLV